MNEIVWKYKHLHFTWVRVGRTTLMHAVDDRNGSVQVTMALCNPEDTFDIRVGMRNTMRSFVTGWMHGELKPKYRLLWDAFRAWAGRQEPLFEGEIVMLSERTIWRSNWRTLPEASKPEYPETKPAPAPVAKPLPQIQDNVIVTMTDGRETIGWRGFSNCWVVISAHANATFVDNYTMLESDACVEISTSVVSWRPLDRPYPIQIVDGWLPLPNGYQRGTPGYSAENVMVLLDDGRETLAWHAVFDVWHVVRAAFCGEIEGDIDSAAELNTHVIGWKPYEGGYPVHFENGVISDLPKTPIIQRTVTVTFTEEEVNVLLDGGRLPDCLKTLISIKRKLTEAK